MQRNAIANHLRQLAGKPAVARYVPLATSLATYNKATFSGDLTAGLIVAVMLVPQSMAYALLAGLPPQTGLYASILPLIVYALFGSSRTLAVAPVAIISLMVASTLAPMAEPGTDLYISLAITLTLLTGCVLLVLGLLRIGFLVNFMSQPVIAGFSSAAALIIAFSQFKHLFGISIERTHLIPKILLDGFRQLPDTNFATMAMAILSLTLLAGRRKIAFWLSQRGLISESFATTLPRTMPLVVVAITVLVTWLFGLAEHFNVEIVGTIPAGLPPFEAPRPDFQTLTKLLPAAILIAAVGFLQSISIAKSLAGKRREKISANRELIGLGAANIASAFTAGFTVTGGFSRSAVNFNTGARTPLAGVISALLVAIVLIFFTPLLHYLPKAALASIIIVAIATMVDFTALRHAWNYNRADGLSFLVTFAGVLLFGVEIGILVGIAVSLGMYLYRTSIPHIAVVGRVGDTEHFRNILRHEARTYEGLLLLRIDESLYFANFAKLEESILRLVADSPKVENLVLICSAVNTIDASAHESLEHLIVRLKEAGVTLNLAEVKGPVADRLNKVDFQARLAPGRIFVSTHQAVEILLNDKAGCK